MALYGFLLTLSGLSGQHPPQLYLPGHKNAALQQTSVRDGILSKGSLTLAPIAYVACIS